MSDFGVEVNAVGEAEKLCSQRFLFLSFSCVGSKLFTGTTKTVGYLFLVSR